MKDKKSKFDYGEVIKISKAAPEKYHPYCNIKKLAHRVIAKQPNLISLTFEVYYI